jgi:hypothetical protein
MPARSTRSTPNEPFDLLDLNLRWFSSCRSRPDGRVAVIDAIALFTGCRPRNARQQYDAVCREWGDYYDQPTEMHHFPGAGQRPTPVATHIQLHELLPRLSGPMAQSMRRQQAKLYARACAGGPSLSATIIARHDAGNA